MGESGAVGIDGDGKNYCGLFEVSATAKDYIERFVCEFIGTFLLVFLGCMGCVQSLFYPNSALQMNLNFGLVVMMVLQCYCFISGAHINPAVTLAAAIYGKLSLIMGLVYFIAQMIGAIAGYAVLMVLIPRYLTDNSFCVCKVTSELTIAQGIGIEFIITFTLITICASVWDPRNAHLMDSLPLRFGFTIASLALCAGSFTGACMNPARAFGPALLHMDFHNHIVYWVGPLSAAVVAALLFKLVLAAE